MFTSVRALYPWVTSLDSHAYNNVLSDVIYLVHTRVSRDMTYSVKFGMLFADRGIAKFLLSELDFLGGLVYR